MPYKTEEIQDRFNEWYDYYYTKVESSMFNINK